MEEKFCYTPTKNGEIDHPHRSYSLEEYGKIDQKFIF